MFVGIDVAKARLDLHLRPTGEIFAVTGDGEGLEHLATWLRTVRPKLVVLEATGGFEITVAAALAAAGLPLAVVNAAQIRAFACAIGRPAKPAVVAARRKLLTILNAMPRDQGPWPSA